MEYERHPKHPREKETFRWWRRNNSILNRDKKNWHGVEGKYTDIPISFEERVSDRGEIYKHPIRYD